MSAPALAASPIPPTPSSAPLPSGHRLSPTAGPERPPRVGAARRERDELTALCVRDLAACTDPGQEPPLRRALVTINLSLATALAGRYRNRGEATEDLEQVAYLGLCHAAQRFDPQRSDSFASFCVPTVLGELRRHFRDRGWFVRPPRRVQEFRLRLLRVQADALGELGREATVAELVTLTGETTAAVAEALSVRSCYSPTSLDRPAISGLSGLAGADDDGATLQDLLPDEDDGTPAAEARLLLASAVRGLDDRDRDILRLRFYDDLTQREIAERVGLSQMQISRVLTRIFTRLRADIGEVS